MRSGMSESLYEQVRQAVHQRWDPIGVGAYSDEMGEYDGYIYALCNLLEKQPSCEQIFNYLWTVETESMGLSGNRETTEEFAEWLYRLVR